MNHFRTTSREQPAIAQGLSRFQQKIGDVLAVLSVVSAVQEILFVKFPPEDTGDTGT